MPPSLMEVAPQGRREFFPAAAAALLLMESHNAAASGRERHCVITAAVGESEDQRKPERFSGHRKADYLPFRAIAAPEVGRSHAENNETRPRKASQTGDLPRPRLTRPGATRPQGAQLKHYCTIGDC